MTTLLFGTLQLTILLALSNLLVRCFSGRAPQLAVKVGLIGITFATALLPLTFVPMPKFEIGGLQVKLANPSEMARSALGMAKQLDSTGGKAIDEQTSDLTGGPGFDFRRLLASLRIPTDLSAGAQWRLLTNCMLAWCLLVGLCMLKLVISLVAVLRMHRQNKVYYDNPQLQRALASGLAPIRAIQPLDCFSAIESPRRASHRLPAGRSTFR